MDFSRPASLAMPFLTLTAHPTVGAVLLDARPAWVWNGEGNRILWANGAGLAFFGETSMEAMLDRSFGDVHPARRHLARLARNARSNAPILDRLRFFLGSEAVTCNCLCKRLEVEGEGVLLVIATDHPSFGSDEAERGQALVDALAGEREMAAACLDDTLTPIAKSKADTATGSDIDGDANAGEIDQLLADPHIVKALAAGADTPLRLVSKPLGEEEDSPVAALVRIGDGPHTRYLLVHYKGQSKSDRLAEDRALLMAEFGDSREAEAEQRAIDQSPDIFAAPFGLSDGVQGIDHLKAKLEQVDKTRDSDFGPFGADGIEDIPAAPDQRNNDGTASGSNIFALPGLSERSAKKTSDRSQPSEAGKSNPKDRPDAPHASLSEKLDKGGIFHFVWESDELGRFSYVSKDLAKAVGPDHAALIGKTWHDFAEALDMDREGKIARAFESRDTWVGLTVHWPVSGQTHRVEVELTGLPIFGRYHGFKGFRGFGMCNTKHKHHSEQSEGALQSDTKRHSSDTALPQFHDNKEIMSDELLRAVNDAVAAAESLISPDGGRTDEPVSSHSDVNGDRPMSDDLIEIGSNATNPGPSGVGSSQLYASNAGDDGGNGGPSNPSDTHHEGHAETGNNQATGPDPYHRVRDLLTESAHGVKAFEPQKSHGPEEDGPQEHGPDDKGSDNQTLSAGEKDAFDEIAAALGGSDFEAKRPDEDVDEDYEEFEDPLAALDDDEVDEPEDQPEEQPENREPSRQTLATGPDTPKPDKAPLDQAKLQKAIQTRSKGDDTLKSAASMAFREIFAMDPAFRHMRERLAQTSKQRDGETADAQEPSASAVEHKKLLAAVQALADGDDLHAKVPASDTVDADAKGASDEALVSDLQAPAERAPDTDTLDKDVPEDGASDDAASGIEPADLDAVGLEESTPEELDEDIAELALLDGADDAALTQDAEPVAADGAPETVPEAVSEPVTDDSATPPSPALAVATAAGVAAISGASLWDRTDTSSPLITLLNKLPVAMIVSAESRILFASRKALSLLGFDDDSAMEKAGGVEGLFSGRPGDWLTKTNGRTTLRGSDGQPLSVLATISSINWGDKPAALLCFEEAPDQPQLVGISEEDEKIAELEAILDTATDGVIVLDGQGHILRMNHSAEALFEVDRHDVAGDSFLDLLAEESHKSALDYLGNLRSNGLASVLNDGRDVIGHVASGGLIPLYMTMGRVNIPGTERFCAVLRDNAQNKRSEEELLTEKILAEDANKQKSAFLAKVSHEIRTPLNAIIGFAEVMMEERFGPIGSERYRDYLKDIKTSGNHIMSLINDLLDLSKVEAGKLDMQFEATRLNRLVSETVSLMQQQANRQHIIIRTSLASELPDIAGDQRSLRQIVLNLLSNAVKFTNAGGQVILSTVHEENGDVVLRIRDTGIGMSEKDLETALEPFRQVSAVRDSTQGTGLGLPLTKALVEANRGHMTLKSKPGEGTLVEVTFPADRVVEPQD